MFEYKVIPAPKKGQKAKGLKTPEDRFSKSLQEVMNTQAQDGWEFLRAETLPSEERTGFRSTTIVYRSVLVFRKAILLEEELAPTPAAPSMAAPVASPAQSEDDLEGEDAFEDEDADEAEAEAEAEADVAQESSSAKA